MPCTTRRFGVGYVFLINLISTGVKLLILLPEWPPFRSYSRPLLRTMLAFGAPLMIAGLAGMVNETADRIILKYLLPEGYRRCTDRQSTARATNWPC